MKQQQKQHQQQDLGSKYMSPKRKRSHTPNKRKDANPLSFSQSDYFKDYLVLASNQHQGNKYAQLGNGLAPEVNDTNGLGLNENDNTDNQPRAFEPNKSQEKSLRNSPSEVLDTFNENDDSQDAFMSENLAARLTLQAEKSTRPVTRSISSELKTLLSLDTDFISSTRSAYGRHAQGGLKEIDTTGQRMTARTGWSSCDEDSCSDVESITNLRGSCNSIGSSTTKNSIDSILRHPKTFVGNPAVTRQSKQGLLPTNEPSAPAPSPMYEQQPESPWAFRRQPRRTTSQLGYVPSSCDHSEYDIDEEKDDYTEGSMPGSSRDDVAGKFSSLRVRCESGNTTPATGRSPRVMTSRSTASVGSVVQTKGLSNLFNLEENQHEWKDEHTHQRGEVFPPESEKDYDIMPMKKTYRNNSGNSLGSPFPRVNRGVENTSSDSQLQLHVPPMSTTSSVFSDTNDGTDSIDSGLPLPSTSPMMSASYPQKSQMMQSPWRGQGFYPPRQQVALRLFGDEKQSSLMTAPTSPFVKPRRTRTDSDPLPSSACNMSSNPPVPDKSLSRASTDSSTYASPRARASISSTEGFGRLIGRQDTLTSSITSFGAANAAPSPVKSGLDFSPQSVDAGDVDLVDSEPHVFCSPAAGGQTENYPPNCDSSPPTQKQRSNQYSEVLAKSNFATMVRSAEGTLRRCESVDDMRPPSSARHSRSHDFTSDSHDKERKPRSVSLTGFELVRPQPLGISQDGFVSPGRKKSPWRNVIPSERFSFSSSTSSGMNSPSAPASSSYMFGSASRAPKSRPLPDPAAFEAPTKKFSSPKVCPPTPVRTPNWAVQAMNDDDDDDTGRGQNLFQGINPPPLARKHSLVINKILLTQDDEPINDEQGVSYMRDFIEEGLLGYGTFAEVYRVREKKEGQEGKLYAVKKSRRQFRSRRDRECLLNEMRTMKRLGDVPCKYLLKLVKAWQEDGYFYAQMDIAQKGTVQDVLNAVIFHGKIFPDNSIFHIIHDVSAGLKHIHNCGLVHLDIKPANLMISAEGIIKIGDFGISVEIGRGEEGHEGDTRYMALEVLTSLERMPPSDIFSLGLTIYELAVTKCSEEDKDSPFLDAQVIEMSLSSSPVPATHSPRDASHSDIAKVRALLEDMPNALDLDASTLSVTHDGTALHDSEAQSAQSNSANLSDLRSAMHPSISQSCIQYPVSNTLPEEGQQWHDLREGKVDIPTHRPTAMQTLIRAMLHPEPAKRPAASQLLAHEDVCVFEDGVADRDPFLCTVRSQGQHLVASADTGGGERDNMRTPTDNYTQGADWNHLNITSSPYKLTAK